LIVGPNPSMGTFQATAMLPEGVAGTVQVFDLGGRMIASNAAESATGFTVAESGVYFVRLATDSGESVTRTVVVLR